MFDMEILMHVMVDDMETLVHGMVDNMKPSATVGTLIQPTSPPLRNVSRTLVTNSWRHF